MDNDILAERVVVLETEGKSKDREIKELKEKVECLISNQNSQAILMQKVLSEQENTNKTLQTIVAFMEDIKAQPKKEKDKFVWLLIGGIVTLAFGGIAFYLGLKN